MGGLTYSQWSTALDWAAPFLLGVSELPASPSPVHRLATAAAMISAPLASLGSLLREGAELASHSGPRSTGV